MAVIEPTLRGRRCAGFTLVEAVISLGVLAIMMMAVMNLLGVTYRGDGAARDREIASALAHDLFTEILQAHYVDPDADAETPSFGPEPGESGRATFDDLDDYDGWTESPPETRLGGPLPGATGFTRHVEVRFVPPADVDAAGAVDVLADDGLKRVKVTVSRADGASVTVLGLRSLHGSFDQEPAVSSTFVRTVATRLRIGEEGATMTTATPVLNQVSIEVDP